MHSFILWAAKAFNGNINSEKCPQVMSLHLVIITDKDVKKTNYAEVRRLPDSLARLVYLG